MSWLAWVSAFLAVLPLVLAARNLQRFLRPTEAPPAGTGVSILIPARNEAGGIARAVHAALASVGVRVEVLVFDDESDDGTGSIVSAIARDDPRVRLVGAAPLPPGWAGKQRACHALAGEARFDVLMFVDVDVALMPDAAALAAGRLLADSRLGMVSGFPRELAVGVSERLVVPWIHVLLLGYLPMDRMRASLSPAYGAACGQWIVARANAYREVGGHGAAPASRHDGTSLPRTFRLGGWSTDVFDGSALATCRMYDGFRALWRGFSKTPGEGMATWRALPVWTVIVGLGHVLPGVFFVAGLAMSERSVAVAGAIGLVANLMLRLMLRARFGQSLLGALLHPLGGALLLANQWASLLRDRLGRPSEWRGRRYVGPRAA